MDLPVDTIIHGDNCDTLIGFPRESIDLVVTSPPYGKLRKYGGGDWDFYGVAWLLSRVLKSGGVIVWVVQDQTVRGSKSGDSFSQTRHFQEIGFSLHDAMIYHTDKPPSSVAHKRYHNMIEFMMVFSKGSPKTFNPIMEPCLWAGVKTSPTYRQKNGKLKKGATRTILDKKLKSNIWYSKSGSGKQLKTSHPAPFPEDIVADHINSWTNPGDVVLDPFSGSGTTCYAAKMLGRHFVGIESHREYVDLSRERVRACLL